MKRDFKRVEHETQNIGIFHTYLTIWVGLCIIAGVLIGKYLPIAPSAPAAMIGASNFFELSVAVAISLFGLHSGATLVTVVGVLVEVPLMLSLVRIANSTDHWFSRTGPALYA